MESPSPRVVRLGGYQDPGRCRPGWPAVRDLLLGVDEKNNVGGGRTCCRRMFAISERRVDHKSWRSTVLERPGVGIQTSQPGEYRTWDGVCWIFGILEESKYRKQYNDAKSRETSMG